MAQIKKIVKPGDLIRGAKVGPAALDKDGNVITLKDLAANAGKVLTVNSDGTVSFQDVPSEFPEGAQSGDVLAWGGETGPEWRPHYPESGSEGDVLTLGETGPEWAPPAGGGKVYLHYCYFGSFTVVFPVEKSTPFTKEEFVEYVNSLLTDSNAAYYLTGNGYYYDSTYGVEPLHLIPLRKQFGTPIFDNNYIRFDGDGVGHQVGHSFSITVSNLANFKDSVLPIS